MKCNKQHFNEHHNDAHVSLPAKRQPAKLGVRGSIEWMSVGKPDLRVINTINGDK